ncbi:TraI domain-containing protein [Cupriavidus pauculus]|uniref:TraI domain-containing protein n=1 Tax=Cupriavidus pauculus TaxID=82633 RepID=UPI001FCFD6AF|nr:TraI domain-containing protein [Cupriavidus pauculus]
MSAGELLLAHGKRIDLIRQYANEAESNAFSSKWMAVLEACAHWFGSMPLRPDEHAEPGGAMRATVEAAYFAMRLSGAQKFGADQPSERRRLLEPQYLYALFLAACCSRLDEPCRHFRFYRASDGAEWVPAVHGAFGLWLRDEAYSVTRREEAMPVERMRTALLAREILGAERLGRFDPMVLADLFGAINPDARPAGIETLLHKVARQAIETTTSFEVKARRAAFAPDLTPAPTAATLAAASGPTQTSVKVSAVLGGQPSSPEAATARGESAAASVQAAIAPAAETQGPAAACSEAEPRDPLDAHSGQQRQPATVLPMDALRMAGTEKRPDRFAEVLGGTSNLMRDFFRAVSQDVAAGKAKVSWIEDKLAISKRMLGSYGMPSESLVDNLRKFGLLYKVVGQEILLADKVAALIAERPTPTEGS